jgi:hypothetical protein
MTLKHFVYRVTFVQEWDKIWQAVKHPQKITVKRNADLKEAPVQVKFLTRRVYFHIHARMTDKIIFR